VSLSLPMGIPKADPSADRPQECRGLGPVDPILPRAAPDLPSPLSLNQERIWRLIHQPGWTRPHSLVQAWRLRGPLDAGLLAAVLVALVARHEALRTAIATIDGVAHQQPLPADGFVPRRTRLHGVAVADRAPVLVARGAAAQRRGFVLHRGPPIDAEILAFGPEDHALVLAIHHIVCDGWSLRVLREELRTLYAARAAGREPVLEPLPIQIADFALWQRTQLARGVFHQAIAAAKAVLRDAPRLEFPSDRGHRHAPSDAGAVRRVGVPLATARALKALATRQGTTTFTVLLAAWALLLARLGDTDEVVVGTIASNRAYPRVEGVVGCFANPIALRIQVGGAATFAELVARATTATRHGKAHQSAPFDLVAAGALAAQSLLIFDPGPPTEHTLTPAVHMAPQPLPPAPVSRFALTLSLRRVHAGLRGFLRYATDLFDAATTDTIARRLAALLAAVAAEPLARPERLLNLCQGRRNVIQDA